MVTQQVQQGKKTSSKKEATSQVQTAALQQQARPQEAMVRAFSARSFPSEQSPFFGRSSGQGQSSRFSLGYGQGTIQTKLTVNQPGDKYEREADAVADQVMRMSKTNAISTTTPSLQRKCSACEEEDMVQRKPIMRKSAGGGTVASPAIASQLGRSKGSGSPLSASTNQFMSQAIGADFSGVRVHTGNTAVQMSEGLNARAFTHGSDVYFNRGEYAPETSGGKRLLAHELVHVVQQNSNSILPSSPSIQRGELEGEDDMCFDYAGRNLREGDNSSSLPSTDEPGGTVLPGTSGRRQNCAGVSLCNRTEWVNWPHLGKEASNGRVYAPSFTGNWDKARYFVPNGCTFVNSSGVNVNATRCHPSEREIMVFLYQWPIGVIRGTSVQVYQSDFHMIGRDCSSLPMAWESKMDRRERVENIQNPWQSLYDAYPHTRQSDREIVQLTFCCDCDKVTTR